MQDTDVRGDPESQTGPRWARGYARAIDALLWQAGDHRCTAAELRRKAADRAAEAAQCRAAADEFERAADELEPRDGQNADDQVKVDALASVDLLRHLAEEHRADAQESFGHSADLESEADLYDNLAAFLERDAARLQRGSSTGPA